MSSGGYFYTVTNDNTSKTEELLEQFDNFDKKQKEAEEKRRRKKEQGEEDPTAVFRAANFICSGGPLGKRTIIPRTKFSDGAIQAHKENCQWCQEAIRAREQQAALRREGPQKIAYILHAIKQAKETIEDYERKKAELLKQRREKREEVDGWEIEKLRRAEYDAGVAKCTIEKEMIELHKLLNHEYEVIRNGANEEYKKYLNRKKELAERKLRPQHKWY